LLTLHATLLAQGQDAATLAEDKASQAAQESAKARALMYKVLSDTAELLGLQG